MELIEKVKMYERFLHLINTAQVSMNRNMMRQLIRMKDYIPELDECRNLLTGE